MTDEIRTCYDKKTGLILCKRTRVCMYYKSGGFYNGDCPDFGRSNSNSKPMWIYSKNLCRHGEQFGAKFKCPKCKDRGTENCPFEWE